jgi:hypothetical protein
MSRKMKSVGIAVAAMLAISAVSAVGAQAASFHSSVEKTHLTGSQVGENIFDTFAGNVKCKKATFTSTSQEVGEKVTATTWKKATATVVPSYSECTAFGQAATITVVNCHYTITPTSATAGTLNVVESGGTCLITINSTAGNCKVTVGAHTPGKPNLVFTNEEFEGKKVVLVTSKVEEIKYTVDGPGTVCGTPGSYSDGKYTGSVRVRGFTDSGLSSQVDITATA